MRSSTKPSKKRCPAWSRRRGLYNSLELIQHNEFPHNQRAIGLWVDKAYRQPGSKHDLVEIDIETCQFLDSVSYVATVPSDQWRSAACKRTQGIIDDIDHVMRELAEHRTRLVAEIAKLDDNPASATPATDTYKRWHVHNAPRLRRVKDMPLWHVHQVHEVDFFIQAASPEIAEAHAHATIGAVTDDGEDVACGNEIAPGVTLVDFDASILLDLTTVEEDRPEDEETL